MSISSNESEREIISIKVTIIDKTRSKYM